MKLKWLNILLLALPLAIGAWVLNRQGMYAGKLTVWIFAFALITVIPLATLLGHFTDELATYFGDRIGGLLGASFGNIPELAIGVSLLIHAHLHAQQASAVSSDFLVIHGLLIGSVINNVLFVLGSAIFLAALRNGRMIFSAASAASYASMLALAVVGLALPTLATAVISGKGPDAAESLANQIHVSVPFGIILILSYVAYLAATVFRVGARPSKNAARPPSAEEEVRLAEEASDAAGLPLLADDSKDETDLEKIVAAEEQEEDAEETALRKLRELRRHQPVAVARAFVGLGAVTLATVAIAAILVSVTDNVIKDTPLTPLSTGLILFPIVCNLGEQAGAVMSAWRNHMEGAMSVAAGSSVQVALFVTPLLVLLSFPLSLGNPSLILVLIFTPLELIVLGLVCFVYALVSLDGETTWLEGLQLLAFYAMMVAIAFVLPGR